MVNNDSGDGMVTKFANGINMVLERDMDKKIWHGSCGVRYEGTKGWVATARRLCRTGDVSIRPGCGTSRSWSATTWPARNGR